MGSDRFPVTRLSAIVAASSANQEERTRAFEVLVSAYWMPVYKYVRIKWNKPAEDARDLTQGFFLEAANGQHETAQGDFARHCDIGAHGAVAEERGDGGEHGDARGRAIFGHGASGLMDVDVGVSGSK